MGVEIAGPVEKEEAVEIAMCAEVHGDVLTGMDLAAAAMARMVQENQPAGTT